MRETERLCAGKNRVKMTGVKILTNPFLNCGYYVSKKRDQYQYRGVCVGKGGK